MGLGQSSLKPSHYNEKKRQNHSILGQITLVEDVSTLHLFTKKMLKLPLSKIPKSLLCESGNRYFLTIKEIAKQPQALIYCSSEEICSVILDCTEVDLQSIQSSKFFRIFTEEDLLNIVSCVIEGLLTLNAHKVGVFPISKKSIFMETKKDEYLGEDLSKAIFKILPLQFTRSDQMRDFMNQSIVPPELQNSFQILNEEIYLHYSPKSQIYCLGMMILDLIADQHQQHRKLDFSFGTPSYPSMQMKSSFTFNSEFSKQFIEMCKMMVIAEEEERIGMTCLSQLCANLIRNKKQNFNAKIKDDSFCISVEKRSKTRPKTRRTISSVGLIQRDTQLQPQISQLKIKSKSKILNDLTNNVQALNEKQKPKMTAKPTFIIQSARQMKIMPKLYEKSTDIKLSNTKIEHIKFQNGAFYEGQLDLNKNFAGFGTLFYNEKQICYAGYWKNNKFHGFGYLFNNKNKYSNISFEKNTQISYRDLGETESGEKINADCLWEHYEGQFKQDLKDGYGILFFLDGSKFQGQFISGKAHGPGTFVQKNGELIYGLWKNHKLASQYR